MKLLDNNMTPKIKINYVNNFCFAAYSCKTHVFVFVFELVQIGTYVNTM